MSYFLRSFIKQQILFLMIAFFAVFLSRIVNNDLSFAFNIQNSLLYSFIQYFISVLIVFSFINLIYFCVRKGFVAQRFHNYMILKVLIIF